MKNVPNILTGLRLVLSVLVFLALIAVAGGAPLVDQPKGDPATRLLLFAIIGFVIASVTDFFDGWLARRYNVTSITGAILDPIADKILVCGGLIGVVAIGSVDVALPAGLILFREFSVSALREVLAPRGIKLPVTFLAKTKTTLQLIAIILIMVLQMFVSRLTYDSDLTTVARLHQFGIVAYVLLWLATLVTVWTGIEYAVSARRALAKAAN
jgi:cardiolipin synthase